MQGDQPIVVIEIDVEVCSLTYGVAPCVAVLGPTAARKCFNTKFTCQDRPHFASSVLTLRLCSADVVPPVGLGLFPCITSHNTFSTSVNIAGMEDATKQESAIGRRGTMSVTVQDFPYNDSTTDKYFLERATGAAQFDGVGYNPEQFGMFFQKLFGRWPHYSGAAVREVTGWIRDGQFVVNRTVHMFLSTVDGPKDGQSWTLKAKDVFSLADEKKAVIPAANNGVLTEDITEDVGVTVKLSPEGIGDAEYPASGRACIGSEVVRFTRVGDDVTLTARGLAGSKIATHAVNDTFQLTKRWINERIDSVYADVIGATTVDTGLWIPTAEWAGEIDRWGNDLRVTRELTSPTKVLDVIRSLTVLGVSLWPDSEERKIRLRVNRPVDLHAGEVIYTVGKGDMIRFEVEGRMEDRLTHVFIHSNIIDPTQSETEPGNYNLHLMVFDGAAEQDYGSAVYKHIFCPWFDNNDYSNIRIVARRFLGRFVNPPARYKIILDVEDGPMKLADVVDATSDEFVSTTGLFETKRLQIIQRYEPITAHEVEFLCQLFEWTGKGGYITPDDWPTYDLATQQQKVNGAWISDGTNNFADGAKPYEAF